MQLATRLACEAQFFDFECSSRTELNGRLLLTETQREWLRDHESRESGADSPWYLDGNGERLPAQELFNRSPWAIVSDSGNVKVLNRLLDLDTGEARFDLPDQYGGESFRWMRE